MNAHKILGIGCLLAVTMIGLSSASAAGKAKKTVPQTPLTAAGEKFLGRYSEMLTALRAEIGKALPAIGEEEKDAFLKARAASKAAEAAASAKRAALDANKAPTGLLEHRKNWVRKAEKAIAQAEGQIKQAATATALKAAQEELVKWQKDKAAGLSELKKSQEAVAKAKIAEPKVTQAHQAAQEALARARTKECMAAKILLTDVEPFLSSDKLDAKLVKCAVLAEATPRGLAEFAQQGKEQEALVQQLLADDNLMKHMLEAGGAKAGKYGQAMKIYTDIQKTSARAKEGILGRLALGTSLEQAVPVGLRNRADRLNAPATVDPVKRYLHYEKAYLDGELDPAFKNMTAWECRFITNADAPDNVLAWGREMLRNYRPDQILTPDYGWRYSVAVRTDVSYQHSQTYKDTDSLEFYQNVIKNGGICGRRAFFGRFIVQSFGLPAWGVAQKGHAALGRWTPDGWVVNLGANWEWSWYDGRTGLDFLLETQARKHPQDHLKALRAQWLGDALGEAKYDSMKPGSGGLWNSLALHEKKAIVDQAKPVELATLGQDLAESNESKATQAEAIAKATMTDADKRIVVGEDGVITVPAAACCKPQGNTATIVFMKSFSGGMQLHYNRMGNPADFEYTVDAPQAGKYALSARVVTVSSDQHLLVAANNVKEPHDIALPYTVGMWEKTPPVEITLAKGQNVLRFSRHDPRRGLSIKDFTLTPVK